MKRSIIQHGPTTLTISLPVKWVRANDINKGDEVEVQEYGNLLKVFKEERNTKKCKEIAIDYMDKELIRSLIGITFKSGYDVLILTYKNSKMIPYIQERVNSSLLGCEILEQSSNRCVINYVHIDSTKEFKNMVRRMFLILDSLGKRSYEMVKEGSVDDSILSLEETMNRLCNSCHRLINKERIDREKLTYFYLVLWTIEGIADEFKYIAEYVVKQKIEFDISLVKMMRSISGLSEKYMRLFYCFQFKKVQEFRQCIIELKNEMDEIKPNLRNQVWLYLYNILNKYYESLNSIVGYHC